MLKDFLATLRATHDRNMRFSYFLDLAGLHSLKINKPKFAECYLKDELLYRCKELQSTFEYTMRIIIMIKHNEKTMSCFLLPHDEHNNNFELSYENARALTEKILKDEKFDREDFNDIIAKLEDRIRQDMMLRLLSDGMLEADELAGQTMTITVDSFIDYMIESHAARIFYRARNLQSSLRLNNRSKYESRLTYANLLFTVFSNELIIDK